MNTCHLCSMREALVLAAISLAPEDAPADNMITANSTSMLKTNSCRTQTYLIDITIKRVNAYSVHSRHCKLDLSSSNQIH